MENLGSIARKSIADQKQTFTGMALINIIEGEVRQ